MNSLVCLKVLCLCVCVYVCVSVCSVTHWLFITKNPIKLDLLCGFKTYHDTLPIILLFPPTSHLIIFHLKYFAVIWSFLIYLSPVPIVSTFHLVSHVYWPISQTQNVPDWSFPSSPFRAQLNNQGAFTFHVLDTQLCLTLCDPMDGSLPSSSVHGIFQARILEWFSISFSRGSSWPRDWTQVSCIAGKFLIDWATRVALTLYTIPANGFLGYLLGGGMSFSFCFCMSAIKLVISSAIYQWSLVKRTFGSLKINWLSRNKSEKERLLGLRARI